MYTYSLPESGWSARSNAIRGQGEGHWGKAAPCCLEQECSAMCSFSLGADSQGCWQVASTKTIVEIRGIGEWLWDTKGSQNHAIRGNLTVYEESRSKHEAAQGRGAGLVLGSEQNNGSGNLAYTELRHQKVPFLWEVATSTRTVQHQVTNPW